VAAWSLHTPGQLHREVTERIRGPFGKVNTLDAWPTVDTYHLGPAVVVQSGAKRFGSVGDGHDANMLGSDTSLLMKSPSDYTPTASYDASSIATMTGYDSPLPPITPPMPPGTYSWRYGENYGNMTANASRPMSGGGGDGHATFAYSGGAYMQQGRQYSPWDGVNDGHQGMNSGPLMMNVTMTPR